MEDRLYANRIGFTDIEPHEVIKKKTERLYVVRQMESSQTKESQKLLRESFMPGGFLGTYDNSLQEWNCTSCEDSECFEIRRHKDGCWYDKWHQKYIISDNPVKFYDFNF